MTIDRMPRAERLGSEHETQVEFVLHTYAKFQAGTPIYMMDAPRHVMGLGLPSWQREAVWDDAQCVRFLESVWKGVPLGFWILNVIDSDGPHPLEGLVIDGQQRLRAVQRYVDGEIQVPAEDGTPIGWNDLNTLERRRFGRARFPYIQTSLTDETKLQAFYDLYNFGGVRHAEHERAVGRALDTAGKELPEADMDAHRRPMRRPR